MNDIFNPQQSSSTEPETNNQTQQPLTGSTKKKGFGKKKISIMVAVATLLIGGAAIYAFTSNRLNPKAKSYGYWNSYTLQETSYDGKIHTKTKDCYDNWHVCHANGSLVFNGGNKKAWRSDPSKNSTGNKLTSPTWDGPYAYSPGSYYDDNYAITGAQKACFTIKDITKNGSAKLAIVVRNAKYVSTYPQSIPSNNAKTVYAVEGTLNSSYKKRYTNLCVDYFNQDTVYKQTYRVYVRKGQIEIDKSRHMYEYYWYSNPYNPYQYNTMSALTKAVAKQQATVQNRSAELPTDNTSSCSALTKRTTDNCLSEGEMKVSSASQKLDGFKVLKSVDVED